jgi:hypothetical protein
MSRHGVVYAPESNIHYPFAGAGKAERNRKLITSFFAFRVKPMTTGQKGINLAYDPLRRDVRWLKQQWRLNASAAGVRRGVMRPASAGLVNYSPGNELLQRTRRPIGPYNTTLAQSVIGRIAGGVTQANGG